MNNTGRNHNTSLYGNQFPLAYGIPKIPLIKLKSSIVLNLLSINTQYKSEIAAQTKYGITIVTNFFQKKDLNNSFFLMNIPEIKKNNGICNE